MINTSGGRQKAVKNWTRPSIDELGIPKEPWKQVYSKNQKKYNMHLVGMRTDEKRLNFLFKLLNVLL